MTPALPDPRFWQGRRVLVTGHTGFKGSWLVAWLTRLGSQVMGLSLPGAVSEPDLWSSLRLDVADLRADLRRPADWSAPVLDFDPQVVLHLAAQPLVSVGWSDPRGTFDTNVLGTAALLEVVLSAPAVRCAVVVTTDKVYDPAAPQPHAEDAPLGGDDPYSASKAAVELLVRSWPARIPVGTARAGNVIGGGDWAEQRLLPDLVRAWGAGRPVVLRHPDGVRPWQHVLEPLRGYLLYAQALAGGAEVPASLNFGPSPAQAVPVRTLVEEAVDSWRRLGRAAPAPAWRPAVGADYTETAALTLCSRLAGATLGWRGCLDWLASLHLALDHYCAAGRGEAAPATVERQLADYCRRVAAA